ncbi:MAG: pilus assembly protein PilM [Phycisphaerae bacterium]
MRLLRHRAGPIAIDFGSYALRVMQLTRGKERTEVLAAACKVYSSPVQQIEHCHGEIVETLRGLLRAEKFIGRRVVSALGERELAAKNIRLPEMPEAELASAVHFEAADRVAKMGEDAEIRFIPAGSVSGGTAPQQEVIVLAAEAGSVRQYLEILAEVGLESAGIDAACCATFRPFERYLRRSEDQNQVNVFVDVGWSSTRIVITRGSQIVFTRSFEVGGAAFDRLVAHDLSLDAAAARKLRMRVAAASSEAGAPDGEIDARSIAAVDAAVRPGWDKLGKEIGLCLRYYAVTFREARPDAVTCVGGESLNTRYLEHLSEVTGLRCSVGYPLRDITRAGGRPALRGAGPKADWTTALGLAMKPLRSTVRKVS